MSFKLFFDYYSVGKTAIAEVRVSKRNRESKTCKKLKLHIYNRGLLNVSLQMKFLNQFKERK
jgi:hypothetical protein